MSKELEKTYNPQEIEDRIYKDWQDNNYFHAKVDKEKRPYTIVIPPPNITGQLHMGHALDNTMQDILIRMKRMQGFEALWQPGTDHASIATEVKILAKLKEEGITKDNITREEFLVRGWEWKEEYGSRIINQLKKLGSSCDWERTRFTMDEGLSKAVNEFFIKLYEDGYIYKGEKNINWCPHCQTTISEAEVEYIEKDGNFWHIKYKMSDSDEFLSVATTRPETLLGDTAVAVHPKDDRYKGLVGKKVILPILNKEIEVIADEYVDMEFGTGVVKITPAHDPNDFEVGRRHNLEIINVMNDDATMNENAGIYKGLDRYEARKLIVSKLKEDGLLIKVEPHTHNVGTHDRCGVDVEPLIKYQWFVKMSELVKPAIKALEEEKLHFVPARFDKTYLHWLENIRDWCISRQLWWGHRIPVYYCMDCEEILVKKERPCTCDKCGSKNIVQDEDCLDTWFSSALWPFSTLGWPEDTEEYKYFYPTTTLVTGYDILFFWVIRMVVAGLYNTKQLPFNTVLLHGLVRDSKGRKMSKSLGNGIDPLDVIANYGADALRLTLVTGNAPGNDMRFYESRVEASRNFANKIWNASRFIMMHTDKAKDDDKILLSIEDRWIISKCNNLVEEITENMEKFELGIAVDKLHSFIWDEFCDWYIEMVKPRLFNEDETSKGAILTLKKVLTTCLKLLHPYMPFITEEIFKNLTKENSIMISTWPVYNEEDNFSKDENEVEIIKEAVRKIRAARSEMNVAPSKKTKVYVQYKDKKFREVMEKSSLFFSGLAYANEVVLVENMDVSNDRYISTQTPEYSIYLPFGELVDISKELERMEAQKKKLGGEILRCENMLNNEKFISKAPESKIEEERKKLRKYSDELEAVKLRILQLSD